MNMRKEVTVTKNFCDRCKENPIEYGFAGFATHCVQCGKDLCADCSIEIAKYTVCLDCAVEAAGDYLRLLHEVDELKEALEDRKAELKYAENTFERLQIDRMNGARSVIGCKGSTGSRFCENCSKNGDEEACRRYTYHREIIRGVP